MTAKHQSTDWSALIYEIQTDEKTSEIVVSGRARWALEELIASGSKGCTPIDNPAPRWSGYVHNLRQMDVFIETIHEKHQGPFAGTRARYVLRCRATPKRSGEVAA
ncbi:winged helix domain-containing protein [Boseongicola aestuarii]|uniref:Winged helix domain-containing protein n=1 Tax=Boseongicola aestuarii TaxID=1470561 RepID=A0A238J0E4_9RHOB|nr:hypothetical protein [Boseongicola aestuarii]SMX23374.1 hypothetical protein BOA8489_01480 [Boseongicola aestuarii]